jgi:hypothetical protein
MNLKAALLAQILLTILTVFYRGFLLTLLADYAQRQSLFSSNLLTLRSHTFTTIPNLSGGLALLFDIPFIHMGSAAL